MLHVRKTFSTASDSLFFCQDVSRIAEGIGAVPIADERSKILPEFRRNVR